MSQWDKMYEFKVLENIEMLRSNFKQLSFPPDNVLAVSLIVNMVGTQDKRSRPTSEAIVMHPYFWDAGKQLRFYSVSLNCFSLFFWGSIQV